MGLKSNRHMKCIYQYIKQLLLMQQKLSISKKKKKNPKTKMEKIEKRILFAHLMCGKCARRCMRTPSLLSAKVDKNEKRKQVKYSLTNTVSFFLLFFFFCLAESKLYKLVSRSHKECHRLFHCDAVHRHSPKHKLAY